MIIRIMMIVMMRIMTVWWRTMSVTRRTCDG